MDVTRDPVVGGPGDWATTRAREIVAEVEARYPIPTAAPPTPAAAPPPTRAAAVPPTPPRPAPPRSALHTPAAGPRALAPRPAGALAAPAPGPGPVAVIDRPVGRAILSPTELTFREAVDDLTPGQPIHIWVLIGVALIVTVTVLSFLVAASLDDIVG